MGPHDLSARTRLRYCLKGVRAVSVLACGAAEKEEEEEEEEEHEDEEEECVSAKQCVKRDLLRKKRGLVHKNLSQKRPCLINMEYVVSV